MELSLRITSETATFEDIIAIVDPVCDRYIISLEQANSRHYQCYVRYIGEDDLKYSKLRYRFKQAGYSGNGSISITKMRNSNLMIYVLKEGNFQYKGFTQEEIHELQEQSYEKPKSYKEKKKEIDNRFKEEYDEIQWWHARVDLFAEYDMGYNKIKLRQEYELLTIQMFPAAREKAINEFFK